MFVQSDQKHKDSMMVKVGAWHSELHNLGLYCQIYVLHALNKPPSLFILFFFFFSQIRQKNNMFKSYL